MGLKSGSRDAGLDDEETEGDEREATDDPEADRGSESDTTGAAAGSGDEDAEETDSTDPTGVGSGAPGSTGGGRPSMESIPYKLRRDTVNEGRQQVPYFLRDDVIEAEDDLQDALEAMLGEDVYKSDYREAAMVVAQRNPELVAEVLREWGYDLD